METDTRIGCPPPPASACRCIVGGQARGLSACHSQASDSRLWLALCASATRARVQASQRRQEEAETLQEQAAEYRQVAADKAKAAVQARASAKREAERRAALRKQVSPRALSLPAGAFARGAQAEPCIMFALIRIHTPNRDALGTSWSSSGARRWTRSTGALASC